jgi:hypothetical protein
VNYVFNIIIIIICFVTIIFVSYKRHNKIVTKISINYCGSDVSHPFFMILHIYIYIYIYNEYNKCEQNKDFFYNFAYITVRFPSHNLVQF